MDELIIPDKRDRDAVAWVRDMRVGRLVTQGRPHHEYATAELSLILSIDPMAEEMVEAMRKEQGR